MRIESDIKLGFKDVMLRPKRSTLSSRATVSVERKFKMLHSGTSWQGIPIMAANMDTVGTFEMAKALAGLQLFTAIHKHYSPADWKSFMQSTGNSIKENIAISTGTSTADAEKLDLILKENTSLRFICIDVANGYSEKFVDFVKSTRAKYADKVIIAGNVVTGEMVEELLLAGAGDVVKAFGGGADFVMLGGMLAGHEESGGELIEKDGKKYKQFYGMSSETAMNKYAGGVAEYRASEGKTTEIPYRGNVADTVQDILGGLRSACTYVGAKSLKELSKRTTFIRVAEQHNEWFAE